MYDLRETQLPVPSDPEYSEGENIDDLQWDNLSEIAHWFYSRRGHHHTYWFNESGYGEASTSMTFPTPDSRIHPYILDADRPQRWHDDWADSSPVGYRLVVFAFDYDLSGSGSYEINLTSFDSAQAQSSAIDVRNADIINGDQQTVYIPLMLKLFTDDRIVGYWRSRVGTDGDVLTTYAASAFELPAIDPSRSNSTINLQVYGAPWVDTKRNTLEAITDWSPEGAQRTLQAVGGDVLFNRNSPNPANSSYDLVSSVDIQSDKGYMETKEPFSLDGVSRLAWGAVINRSSDHELGEIIAKADSNVVSFSLSEKNGDIEASIRVGGGSLILSASASSSQSTWEAWLAYYVNGTLHLYKNGSRVAFDDTGSASDTLRGGNGKLAVGASPEDVDGGANSQDALIATPFVASDLDQIDFARVLGWQLGRAGVADTVDLT